MSVNSINYAVPQRFSQFQALTYRQQPEYIKTHDNSPADIKLQAVASAFVGMSVALAHIVKKQGFPINPKILKTIPIKDWAIFKIAKKGVPNQKLLQIEEKEILQLATGSVLGGLAGGAIFDHKNMKAKGREALTQMLGNVISPVLFVGGASRLYKKFEDPIKSAMPQFKNSKKSVQYLNKFIKNLPAVGITGLALVAGIFTGSKITNFINEKCFGQTKHRDIKTSDFAPHVDDLCLAVTLMGAKDSPLATGITRTVPLFLTVPGYQVGKAR